MATIFSDVHKAVSKQLGELTEEQLITAYREIMEYQSDSVKSLPKDGEANSLLLRLTNRHYGVTAKIFYGLTHLTSDLTREMARRYYSSLKKKYAKPDIAEVIEDAEILEVLEVSPEA